MFFKKRALLRKDTGFIDETGSQTEMDCLVRAEKALIKARQTQARREGA